MTRQIRPTKIKEFSWQIWPTKYCRQNFDGFAEICKIWLHCHFWMVGFVIWAIFKIKLFCVGVMKKVDLVNSFNGGDENCFSWSWTKCAIWDIHDFHCALALGHIPYWFSHAVEGDGDDEDGFGLGRRAHIASLQFKASFNFQLSLGNGLGTHFYCMQ